MEEHLNHHLIHNVTPEGQPTVQIFRGIRYRDSLLFHLNLKEFGPAGPELYAQFLSLLWRHTVKGSGSILQGLKTRTFAQLTEPITRQSTITRLPSPGSATVSINSPLIPSSSHPPLKISLSSHNLDLDLSSPRYPSQRHHALPSTTRSQVVTSELSAYAWWHQRAPQEFKCRRPTTTEQLPPNPTPTSASVLGLRHPVQFCFLLR